MTNSHSIYIQFIFISSLPQDLAFRNDLNVTDVKFYSDYLRVKMQILRDIVTDTYRRTRSEWQFLLLYILFINLSDER